MAPPDLAGAGGGVVLQGGGGQCEWAGGTSSAAAVGSEPRTGRGPGGRLSAPTTASLERRCSLTLKTAKLVRVPKGNAGREGGLSHVPQTSLQPACRAAVAEGATIRAAAGSLAPRCPLH